MGDAKVWKETVTIPTYGIGKPDKNPMFLEKRVYQGSSGKVYPYSVIESLVDEKKDKQYIGLYLENQYIKILILPEIGGKIHYALDKTNGYEFIYHNEVIKPALVGLLGPWVSGGIEFNWPQHHRPTTFMCTDYCYGQSGSDAFVKVHDLDRINGTEVVTTFSLYSDKSYIEVSASLFNPTSEAQTFLWWANPAVAVNDQTQSIFPPDVTAVYDHGKRAVSKFPIASGVYYKHDYSLGVDISRFRNLPVPTSYMAYKSNYDFVGGYDYGKKAGLLHVADHHISPGKKQWTWGCGDFGQAWDRNLTDENGPYIELMTGVYTDNQPDFSWLEPYEEKHFTQYFLPYKELAAVKNASVDVLLNLEVHGTVATVLVYATSQRKVRIVLCGDKNYLDENTAISPTEIFSRDIPDIGCQETELTLGVYDENGVLLLSYQKETPSLRPLPESAKEAKPPKEILTNEELYLTAQHIEQYRHATYLPDPYYEEGLRRDNGDSRINNAYGVLLLRRGLFSQAEQHFRTAIERLTQLHPNPYDSEPFTNLGFALEYQGRYKEAYDAFFKATWSEAQAGVGYYKLASLATRSEEYGKALEFAKRALQYNSKNIRARNLVALLLFLQEKEVEAILYAKETLAENPFAYLSAFLLETHGCDLSFNLNERMENKETTFLSIAAELISYGQASLASVFLTMYQGDHVMIDYYRAYAAFLGGEDERSLLIKAREADVSCVFANTLFDQVVLQHAITQDAEDPVALYMLGNLCYDKLRYEEAYGYWKRSSEAKNSFATVHRNLALVLFNKKQDKTGARAQLEEAYRLDNSDARVFMELDQLYQKMGMSVKERLENYQEHANLIIQRDDLMTCYATLLNLDRQHEKSYAFLCSHKFHPWEGGEGRVSSQYVFALRELARSAMEKGDYEEALRLLDSSLRYPLNLGEGKLEGRKDNDIHYYKGCCYEQMGKEERARAEFSLATLGEMEPAGVMFYYDQPADMILYQGLACRKLGDEKGAAIRFNRLIDYGEAHYFDRMKVDYFAVSLPDMQLFEDDLDERNRIHCKFLLALGYYGKGEKGKAQELLSEVRKSNPTHMGAVLLLR